MKATEIIWSYLSDVKNYLPIIPLTIGILIKFTLDLNLGKFWVKYFYWLSFRSIFRLKSNKISGIYKQRWSLDQNSKYPNISDKQSLITLKQLNNYVYGEYWAKNGKERYCLFGEIIDRKIIGHWQNVESKLGYFGAFELSIIHNKKIVGYWTGHSQENPNHIKSYNWEFVALTNINKPLVPTLISIWIKGKKGLRKRVQKKV